jgi:hypothetical protein
MIPASAAGIDMALRVEVGRGAEPAVEPLRVICATGRTCAAWIERAVVSNVPCYRFLLFHSVNGSEKIKIK